MVRPSMGFLGALAFGHHGHGKAQLGSLLQALLAARRRAHLTSQPHFAKGQEAARQRLAPQAGGDGQHHRQVGRRLR